MISCKPITQKLTLTLLSFFIFSAIKISAQDGKAIFQSKCATCHNVFKPLTGPALGGLTERGPWTDRQELYKWIHSPETYLATNQYAKDLQKQYTSIMTAFPALTTAEIDAVVDYIEKTFKEGPDGPGPKTEGSGSNATESSQNAVIFGVISLILAVIALILMQVNSNLKKMSDDSEGIQRPEPVPFYRNKVYIAMLAIIFFIVAGFYATKVGIGMQRQKDYQPEQPIFYSHKIHAGINQISCLYCHGNAWESKTAAIPSVNVCMNCHKTITEYSSKSPKLYRENGEEVNGTVEIGKLHAYAGFDPKNPNAWDPSKAKPIEWTKIHNLPDHVYFNHSQHVKAGKVQCQTCHGEVTAMDEVKQFTELSMGWCVNCHRQTKVDFNYDNKKGNKFYSIYEKFHNDLRTDTLRNPDGTILRIIRPKMDSVTVKDIGGLECQKCHY